MTLLRPDTETLASSVGNPSVDDWFVLLTKRPNALISGPREATDAALLTATRSFRLPIRRVACDVLPSLPPVGGTVILDNVDLLDGQQQKMLLRWLDEGSRSGTQVISITPTALYRHVQAGTFLTALFYRLNVIYLEVSTAGTEPS
jgi:hypothetical protein